MTLMTAAGAPPETRSVLEESLADCEPTIPDGVGDGNVLIPSPRRASIRELHGVEPGCEPDRANAYDGAFEPGGDLRFGDGLLVRVRHYGVALFESLDAATVLLVSDDDDFSAYLRDADGAWEHGQFAGYVTHPQALIADLAALGGQADHAGPRHRLYVGEDGIARTSPFGRGLGFARDGIPALMERWDRWNAGSTWPDSCCLSDSIPEEDRVAALEERPWMRRYVTVLRALRGARVTGRIPQRVSGFGGRLSDEAPGAGTVDADHAPVLAQFGGTYRAIDPFGDTWVEIDAEQVRAIEALLGVGDGVQVPGGADACQVLLAAGVARDWCLERRATVPASFPEPVWAVSR